MACTVREVDDSAYDPELLDRQLGLALIHEARGDAGELVAHVLRFLAARTNFFARGDGEARLLEAYRTVAAGRNSSGAATAAAAGAGPAASAASDGTPQAEAPPGTAPVAAAPPDAPTAAPPAAPPEARAAAAGPSDAGAGAGEPKAAPPAQDVEAAPGEQPDQSKGMKPNAGRGADLGRYSWTQTLGEVTVCVPVPPGTKGRALDVSVTKTRLRVGVKGAPPIIDGKLSEPVKADDCLWNLSDDTVEVTLTKAEGMHWWRAVVEGDPQIDTAQVEPENSKLDELDPETRTTVEKMMFDQRQKALGLPTSDEMQKQEMLRKFMASHPEMDFSNAKIQY